MKWLKIAGLIVFISIIIGIVALVTLPYRMAREIDARIAAIKAQGDPVSGKDLIPHVPDSENGAVIYEKVFRITEPGREEIGKASKMTSSPDGAHEPGALASARRIASKYRSVLPLIEEASSRPQCRFKSNWSDPVEERLQPYLDKVRNVSQLLSVIAIVDAADGKMDDSVRTVGLSYKLSESLNDEPRLTGSVTRYKCISAASRSLKQSMQYGNISERQAHKLFDLLRRIDVWSGFQIAMKGERATGLDMMDRMRQVIRFDNDDKRIMDLNIIGWLQDVRSCADELFYLKYMDHVMESVSMPYRDQIAYLDEREPDFPSYVLMSVIVTPIYAKSMRAHHEAMATLAGDRVFLAVLAYRSKFGGYPASLDDVESRLGWKLPMDPMTGKQFRYRREGDGFIVYGLGKNLKDDNAMTIKDPMGNMPESVIKGSKYHGFLDKYPYTNGDGKHSADMIWQKSK